MRDTDTAYISALIDSIGTIKIESPRKGEIDCLYVWITHSDFKLMEYLQRAGAFIITLGEGQFRAKWKDYKAYRLLKSIIVFSKMKREHMQCGIEFFEAKTSEQTDEKFNIIYRLRLKMLKKTEDQKEKIK
jgi:hypothetical protein